MRTEIAGLQIKKFRPYEMLATVYYARYNGREKERERKRTTLDIYDLRYVRMIGQTDPAKSQEREMHFRLLQRASSLLHVAIINNNLSQRKYWDYCKNYFAEQLN